MSRTENAEKTLSKWQFAKAGWQEVRYVLIAGAIGGLASWAYGMVLGEPVPGGVWAVPVAVFLGAFAAGVAVYVLTNTDTSAVARTLFFAMLCGFVWKPVLDAGKALVQQTIQQRQDAAAQDAGDRAQALATSLTSTPPAQLPTKLEEVHDAALAAMEALPQASNPRVRREVETKVSAALTMVSQVAEKNPPAVSKILQNIGDAAANNQAVKVANQALMSLDTLSEKDGAFSAAHHQLRTNIANIVSSRYLLVRPK